MWLLEDVARSLLLGGEPVLSCDEEGNLYSIADGRLVAGPRRRPDVRDVFRTIDERFTAASGARWRHFLAADEEAEDLLEQILARGRSADPPPDLRVVVPPYVPEGGDSDPGDLEALRRLTWALATDAEATRLLSELTRRRDAFAAEGWGVNASPT